MKWNAIDELASVFFATCVHRMFARKWVSLLKIDLTEKLQRKRPVKTIIDAIMMNIKCKQEKMKVHSEILKSPVLSNHLLIFPFSIFFFSLSLF